MLGSQAGQASLSRASVVPRRGELPSPGLASLPCALALLVRTQDWLLMCGLLHGQFDYFSFFLFF